MTIRASIPRSGPIGDFIPSGLLVRNVLWNLAGQGAPLVVAIVAIPILVHALGTDRFGVLALAWVVVGYFSLFDFGVGRALTQLLARRLGSTDAAESASLASTSLLLMLGLGVLGGVVIASISPWLVHSVLRIPAWLQQESLVSFLLLASSVPIVISTAGLRGILEAHQRFALSNLVRIPLGLFTFLGPVAVLPFTHNLAVVVLVLVAGRVLAWLAYLLLSVQVMPGLGRLPTFNRAEALPLLRFGGWMTVSNVVGPLMVYLDRFLIGALISVAALAYYAVPFEAITKLWLIAGALTGVLFPAFAHSFTRDSQRTTRVFGMAVKFLTLVFLPITVLVVALAHPGLSLWLGQDFANHSSWVLRWLAIGVFANSLAQVPFALIQAAGRPDLTAKIHLLELFLYLAALLLALSRFGIDGAAFVWMIRTAVDMAVMFVLSGRLLSLSPEEREPGRQRIALVRRLR
jgi:O-antigen/teichoic acid export membrane protein